ncbi:MAG: ABC transporter permease, partial [Bacteroidetes bacterium]|nr:ABC transporter permease [Bacteroidota bacterium]
MDIIRDNYLVPYLRRAKNAAADDVAQNRGVELQPITDIHLKSEGIYDIFPHSDIRIVWIFGTIALFVLLLACINFINLSTAKSANRAREVGLRKVIGSVRRNIINQFLTESVLFSGISFLLGIMIARFFLPYFNTLADKEISFPWQEWWFIPVLIGSSLLIGVLAGIYPSFYLSSFKPVDVLKGTLSRGSRGSVLQSTMVVFQFATSIILIIGAVVVNRQMSFILNSKIGFDKDQVIILQGTNTIPFETIPQLKNELQRIPEVKNATISNYLPISGTKRDQNSFWKEGMVETEKSIGAQIWFVGNDYINTMGMNLIAGRDFDKSIASDSSGIIINQAMAKAFGFEDPIGKRITNNRPVYTIIGVVEDFHFESVKNTIRPLSLVMGNFGENMPIKIQGANIPETLTAINKVWDEFAPNQPMRYTFLD